MPRARPFTGLLYDEAVSGALSTLTTPPYDAISATEQGRFYRASPFNVVRLILGRDEPGDDSSTNKYTRAASYLRSWRDQGALVSTSGPRLYPYELEFHFAGAGRRVRGLIAEVDLEPWDGSILPHERTLSEPIEDRLNLLRAVRINLSPVYAVFAGPAPRLSAFLDAATSGPPDREITDESGTRHRLWITATGADVVGETLSEEALMIADGHHRYQVALAYREEMRKLAGPGPWDAMMMLVVDAGSEDPPVLPFHRVLVRGGAGPNPPGERVLDMAEILATIRDEDLTYGTVRIEDDELVHRVASLEGRPPTVCALHEQVLDDVAGVELRFVPDSVAAEQSIVSGEARAAYILPPTKVDLVWSIVRSKRRFPQKSTYFWPKPRTGMVFRSLLA